MFLSNCSPETKRHQLTAQNTIFGNTPLHVAAFLGNEAIVETIMEICDDVKELLQQRNWLGDTPVHAAAKNQKLRFMLKLNSDNGCASHFFVLCLVFLKKCIRKEVSTS